MRAPLEVSESLRPCFTESERLERLGDTEYLLWMWIVSRKGGGGEVQEV